MIAEAANRRELEQASDILLRAFRGNENARLGRGYARAMLRSFADTSARVLLVATEEGRVAGFAAGEPAGAVQERYHALRSAAARSLAIRPWLICTPDIFRMAVMRLRGEGHRDVPEESWFLALIAVDPAVAGRGIGRELLQAFEQEGARRGFSHASLQVAATNTVAQALYSGCGWATDGTVRNRRICYVRTIQPGVIPHNFSVNFSRGISL